MFMASSQTNSRVIIELLYFANNELNEAALADQTLLRQGFLENASSLSSK